MAMALRMVGVLLMVCAALYLAQFLVSTLYDNPQRVWDVMNYVSALAILIALAANFKHMRCSLAAVNRSTSHGSAHTPCFTPMRCSPSGTSATGSTCWRCAMECSHRGRRSKW